MAVAMLLALPQAAQAAVPEEAMPGPFKTRIINILKSNPFSVCWDGSTVEMPHMEENTESYRKKAFIPADAPSIMETPEPYSPEIFVEEDSSLDASEDNIANKNAVLYEYTRGESYDVYAAPGYISDVQLKPGETITGITIGDAISWAVETRLAADRTWHVYIRPLQLGVATNMIINIDEHYYSLRLTADSDYYPIVSWSYTGEAGEEYVPQGISMEVESVQDINFDYRISSGKYDWTPGTVFDDGFKTYLVLKEGAAARHTPVIFQKRGGLLLNMDYRIVNGTIIIDRVCDEIYMCTSNSDRVVIKNEHAVTPWNY